MNMLFQTNIQREGLKFYNVEEAPFRIYGVRKENGLFRRMPEAIAKSISERVYSTHTDCAGGRVRFVTDSPYLAIQTTGQYTKWSRFALGGSCGFSVYTEMCGRKRYAGSFAPPFDVTEGYEGLIEFPEQGEKLVTLEMPLYSSVSGLLIGLKEGSILKKSPDYAIEKPVVFYGSSITQGGFASKSGSCYESILSRQFDFNYINLGFASGARAEDAMAEYIRQLDMSVFVYDYDHNAPNVEHLKNTHKKMFDIIREANPDLPIIMMSRPKYYLTEEEKQRFEVILDTYLSAKENGDANVYLISGEKLMELVLDNGLADSTHPTDSGFFSMAKALADVIFNIFYNKGMLKKN